MTKQPDKPEPQWEDGVPTCDIDCPFFVPEKGDLTYRCAINHMPVADDALLFCEPAVRALKATLAQYETAANNLPGTAAGFANGPLDKLRWAALLMKANWPLVKRMRLNGGELRKEQP